MRRLRRALESQERSHIKAVFWDYPSLPQKPRSGAEEKCFKQALTVMGDLYASALGVTVLRHRLIPARPRSYDGELVLLPPDKWGLGRENSSAVHGGNRCESTGVCRRGFVSRILSLSRVIHGCPRPTVPAGRTVIAANPVVSSI